ncbi:hypothetical protein QNO07_05410 [Streptomyces sp. 549]|uniref:hypothetical protein n=1 Tax=Streptomyces sp. 549 TaxID=3049076 RepID=UPI0024C2F99B|nr:hypothetical protein [Streptomyces sp. 549]MDK1472873.1 hypothetical protein [Streptomyces sp. 549]
MSFGQGGPAWGQGPSGGPQTPDWNALAEQAEAAKARKRRLLLIGGGALATVAVAAVVAVTVVSKNGTPSDRPSAALPSPEQLPPSPAQPKPSFNTEAPPPPNPMEFISDPEKDTAPISVATLFPGKSMESGESAYTKTASRSAKDCASVATAALGPVLTANGCQEVHRATYVRDGIAVTVGIAVFESEAAAKKAKDNAQPNIAPLPGGGTPEFCRFAACRTSANSVGRYGYFTVSGYLDGTNVTTEETKARAAGLDVARYAFGQIRQRGEEQATAAATSAPD